MKKVDSNNGVWVNDDPTTLTNGTPIDADFMNNIQDEISNVITDNGETLDGTNHSQLSQTLDKTFAKLNSPTLIGVPLTSNPDGTINNQIATVDYVNQKALQATVGFVPTQQGGGTDQGANKVYIGGDSTDATQVRVQVDQTDLGRLVFQDNDAYTHGVDQIGFNIGGQTFAFRDASDKSWRFLYTTSQIDEKSYISSLPTGDNTKVTDIIWNTSSNLPAYYYGADNQVSYSATTEWSQQQFLQLSDEGTQSVSGPVSFSGANTHNGNETFSGPVSSDYILNLSADTEDDTCLFVDGKYIVNMGEASKVWVPTVTDFSDTGVALNITTAEGRYVRSVPDAGSTDKRINGIWENADGRLVFGDGTASPVVANLTDLPLSDPTQKIQVFTAYVKFSSNGYTTITFPKAFAPGVTPTVVLPSTQEQPGKWSFIGIAKASDGTLSISNTGFTIYGVGWGGGSSFYNLIENNFIPVIAVGAF